MVRTSNRGRKRSRARTKISSEFPRAYTRPPRPKRRMPTALERMKLRKKHVEFSLYALLVSLVLASALVITAEFTGSNYSLNSIFPSTSGNLSSSSFSMISNFGQPIGGNLSSSNFALESGFLFANSEEPPKVDSVSWSPLSPSSGDDLICSTVISDLNFDDTTFTANFTIYNSTTTFNYLNTSCNEGQSCSTVLDFSNTKQNEQWTCSVEAIDAFGLTSESLSDSVTVEPNTPPTTPTVIVTPTSPAISDDITCTASSTDADADTITYTYQWTVAGTVKQTTVTTSTTDILPNSETDYGNLVTCQVTPADPYESGTSNYASVTVAAAPGVTGQISRGAFSFPIKTDGTYILLIIYEELPITIPVDIPNLAIDQIIIKTNKNVGASEISVSYESDECGAPGINYQCIRLEKNIDNEDLDYIEIQFTIERAWFVENNIAPDSVTMYRSNNGWTALGTNKVSETDTHITFSAKTGAFSTFAIAGQLKVLAGVCGNGIVEPGETSSTCCLDAGCPDGQRCVNNICTLVTVCGNNVCDPGETYENCPQDCPLEDVPAPTVVKFIESPLFYIIVLVLIAVVIIAISRVRIHIPEIKYPKVGMPPRMPPGIPPTAPPRVPPVAPLEVPEELELLSPKEQEKLIAALEARPKRKYRNLRQLEAFIVDEVLHDTSADRIEEELLAMGWDKDTIEKIMKKANIKIENLEKLAKFYKVHKPQPKVEKLKEYMAAALTEGYDRELVRQILLYIGWDKEVIDENLHNIKEYLKDLQLFGKKAS